MELAHSNATLVAQNTSESSLSALLITYPAWFSLTICIWHHLLYLDEEVDIIWNTDHKNFITRWLYAVARYGTDITYMYTSYVSSGLSSNLTLQHCVRWGWLTEMLITLVMIFRHVSVFVTIKSLWAGRTKMKYILVIAWFVSFTPITVLSALAAIQAQSTFLVIPPSRHMAGGICIISRKISLLPWMIASLAIGDLIQVVAMVVNALDAPRLSDKQIISSANHDGAFYYFLSFVIRVVAALILWFCDLKYYGIVVQLQGVASAILPLHHYLVFSKAKKSAEVLDGFHCMEE